MSPTQLSLKYYRDAGYRVEVVEHWNIYAKIRQDLFGIFDLLAVGFGETIGVQTTSYSHVAERVRKIEDSEFTPILRKCGWKLVVHGWRKEPKTNKWVVREVDLS